MSSLNKSHFSKIFLSYLPLGILFFSVFNEFDFNFLKIELFSFNFIHILIFYWTLRNPEHLGYISIFLAGLVNDVVPIDLLEKTTVQLCNEILERSPMAIRILKAALNADCDGQSGLQQLAGDATMLFYMSDEAKEGRDAFKEKRKPDFKKFPRLP